MGGVCIDFKLQGTPPHPPPPISALLVPPMSLHMAGRAGGGGLRGRGARVPAPARDPGAGARELPGMPSPQSGPPSSRCTKPGSCGQGLRCGLGNPAALPARLSTIAVPRALLPLADPDPLRFCVNDLHESVGRCSHVCWEGLPRQIPWGASR